MKKFKIDKKGSKKIVSGVLIGMIALTALTGCNANNKNKSFLDNTSLKSTNVISFDDGHKDIAILEASGCSMRNCNCDEIIYKSIVTGELFADDNCTSNEYYNGSYTVKMLNHYNIVNHESIISYLTNEEIDKASKNELTDEDITNIFNRIFVNSETNEKIR